MPARNQGVRYFPTIRSKKDQLTNHPSDSRIRDSSSVASYVTASALREKKAGFELRYGWKLIDIFIIFQQKNVA